MAKTVAQLHSEIDANLPTTGAGAIDAADVRATLHDIIDNEYVAPANIVTTGTPDSGSVLWGDGWRALSGGAAFKHLASNTTVVAGDVCYCDTSAGPFTLTLPGSPAVGQGVGIRDAAGKWNVNNLTISAGSNNINSAAGSLVCNVADVNFDLVWRGPSVGWYPEFLIGAFSRGAGATIVTGAASSSGANISTMAGRSVGIISGVASSAGANISSAVYGTTFTDPSSLPNLKLWLDTNNAGSIDLSGSTVTQWRDRSTNNNHLLSPAGATLVTAGLNSKNTIAISNGPSALSSMIDLTGSSYTGFLVYKKNVSAAFPLFGNSTNTSMRVMHDDLNGHWYSYANSSSGSFRIDGSTTSTGSFERKTVTWDALTSTGHTYIGGTDNTNAVAGPLTITVQIDQMFAALSLVAEGEVAEVVLYDRLLNSTERGQVWTYLNTKWGV